MKVDDLVILQYIGVDLKEKDRKKVGIVRKFSQDIGLFKVFWSSGDETWCLREQLQAVKKCP